MTAVCSVGIDMVAVPGDTTAEVISGLIADEIAIGVVNTKTTAVRVIPAIGKKVGDMVEFGGLLGAAPIMPIKTGSPAKFINRGGRIPARSRASRTDFTVRAKWSSAQRDPQGLRCADIFCSQRKKFLHFASCGVILYPERAAKPLLPIAKPNTMFFRAG